MDDPQRRPVLVFGTNGFIGRSFTQKLTREAMYWIAFDRSAVDLNNANELSGFVQRINPWAIVFLGCPVPSEVEFIPSLLSNHLASLDTCITAMPVDCHFWYTGSMSEYGYSGRHKEDDPRHPHNPYAFLKMTAVDRVMYKLHELNRRGGVARLFGVYGSGEGPKRLLPSLVAKLKADVPVPLSNGLQERDFIYVEDVVDILTTLLLNPYSSKPTVINIGSGFKWRVKDLCENIADRLLKSHDLLRFGDIPRQPYDEDELIAEVSTLRQWIGYIPANRLKSSNFLDDLIQKYGGG